MYCLSSGNCRHQSILCWLLQMLLLLKNMKSQLEDLQRLKEAGNQKLLCSFQVAALVSNSGECRFHHRGCLSHKLKGARGLRQIYLPAIALPFK